MEIEWWTLGLQAINFLVLVWLLSRFLYRPVRNVIAERKAQAERALSAAEAREAEAEAARATYDSDRAALRQQRQELEAEVHRNAQADAERIIEAARKEAAEIRETATSAAADERARTLEAIKGQVAAMAVDLASGLLARGGTSGAAAAIQAVGDVLDELPRERRDELRRDAAGQAIEVRTADEPSETDRKAWTEALRRWFGEDVRADFAIDPGLLGGVLLRLPHSELDLTWARHLREAEARMLGGDDEPRA